jgi:hypothetical protein
MTIRYAVPADVPALSAVEAECFPPAEALLYRQLGARVCWFFRSEHTIPFPRIHSGN